MGLCFQVYQPAEAAEAGSCLSAGELGALPDIQPDTEPDGGDFGPQLPGK